MIGDLIWIDLETTGLSPAHDEIIEVGAIRTDAHGAHPVERDWRVQFTAPMHPRAAEVNGYESANWRDALPLPTVLKHLSPFMADAKFANQNPSFDERFLRAGFEKCGIKYPRMASYHLLDIASLAHPLVVTGEAANAKLDTIARALGLEPEEKPHRALAGARKTVEVYRALLLREGVKA